MSARIVHGKSLLKQLCVRHVCLTGQYIRHASSEVVGVVQHEVTTTPGDAKPVSQIPGDKRIPVISFIRDIFNINNIRQRGFVDIYKLYLKYGEILQFRFLSTTLYVISSPQIVEDICRQEDAVPSRKENFASALGAMIDTRIEHDIPSGLFYAEGEEWAEIRKILSRRLLRPIEVKNYFDGFCSTAESLIAEVNKHKDEKGVIKDLRKHLETWSLESLGTFIFGKRIGLMSNNPDQTAKDIVNDLQGYLMLSQLLSFHKLARYIFPGKYRQLRKMTDGIHRTGLKLVGSVMDKIQDSIDKGEEIDEQSAKSLVAYLMRKDQLSPSEVVTHAIDLFTAGLDTTTMTTSWLLYLIASNPEAQEKLSQEVQQSLSESDIVTHQIIQRMPYLRACMKEASRLYPTTDGFFRIYDNDIEAGGYLFPAKSQLLCSNYNMGRSEKYFQDPLTFQPERWLRNRDKVGDINEDPPHPFSSLPFGFGPRSCVGRRISEAEMQTLVVLVLKRFKLSYLGEQQTGILQPILAPDKPLTIAFQPRE